MRYALAVILAAVPAFGEEPDPIDRAVRFLATEVPRWSTENHCYSCHNNGDAARALYTAAQLGYPGLGPSLVDTTAWLEAPHGWRHNGGDQTEQVSDPRLANLQFTFALLTAVQTGQGGNPAALREAAALVANYQADDGSWPIDAPGTIGSPATYGARLATLVARRALVSAGPAQFKTQIDRAEEWLRRQRPNHIFDAAVTLMALHDLGSPADDPAVQQSFAMIRRGEAKGGGWGPSANSSAEPFDTAMVLLGLAEWQNKLAAQEIIEFVTRGRRYLLDQQLDEGGWPETTRPADGISYAQHLSTSGWVTLALLRTGTQPIR
jgi:hypothetical protein